MTMRDPDPLERLIDVMQRAGLDISVHTLLDSLWLALQGALLDFGLQESVQGDSPANSPIADQERATHESGTVPTGKADKNDAKKIPDRPNATTKSGGRSGSDLFAAGAGKDEKDTLPASPLRIPAAAALACKLPLTRSLRPLRKWFKNRQFLDLNEEATAEATATARGMIMPVLQPRLERWYELIIVADSVPSMDVWFETLVEFQEVARTAGVFRDIRHYRLLWKEDDDKRQLGSPPEDAAVLINADNVTLPAVTLAQTNVRRLIFLATNGSGRHWTDGRMAALLGIWSRLCSVALVQMLPEHLWQRVRTGEPKLLVRALAPGVPAASLETMPLWWEEDFEDAGANLQNRIPGAIPVLPLDPAWMAKWARMQMGGGQAVPAIVVNKLSAQSQIGPSHRPFGDWAKVVDAFSLNCTPEAWNLAVYLSRGPFTLPVARLVQATKLGSSASQTQLAEILLSGLVQRVTPAEAKVLHEWVEYQLHPEAAKILSRGLRESDAEQISRALVKHIERYWGKPVDFRALVYDPNGLSAIPKWAQPFAQLGRSLLKLPQPQQAVDQFLKSQPPRIIGDAAQLADEAGQNSFRFTDIQLRKALAELGMVSQNAAGDWQFHPVVQSALAKIAAETPLRGIQILWVDDNPKNNEFEAGHLVRLGAAVEPVLSTDDALRALRGARFDIVISDMGRRRDSRAGFTLLTRFHELQLNVPVIIYSSRFAARGREAAFRAGAFDCTNIPEELFSLVNLAAASLRHVTVPVPVVSVLRSIGLDAGRIRALLKQLQETPEEIATEILRRAASSDVAFHNHLRVIQAYATSGVNQLIRVESRDLIVVTDVVDFEKNRYQIASWGGLIGLAAREARIVWVPDVSRDSNYIPAEPTTASELVLPLLSPAGAVSGTKKVIGVINIEMSTRNQLNQQQIEWLARFTAPLAGLITGAQSKTESSASPPAIVGARNLVMTSDFFGLCYLMLCQLTYGNENDAHQTVTQIKQGLPALPVPMGTVRGVWRLAWGPAVIHDNSSLMYAAEFTDATSRSPVFATVVVRGSDIQATPSEILRTILDVDAAEQVVFPANNQDGSKIARGIRVGLNVLNGFQDADTHQTVTQYVQAFVARNPDAPIVVTGHGWGGCQTTVLALDLALTIPAAKIVPNSFAAPTAGNVAFTRLYEQAFKFCPRWVNVMDLVPMAFAGLSGIKQLWNMCNRPAPNAIKELVTRVEFLLSDRDYAQQSPSNNRQLSGACQPPNMSAFPSVQNQTVSEIERIVQDRMEQLLPQGSARWERVALQNVSIELGNWVQELIFQHLILTGYWNAVMSSPGVAPISNPFAPSVAMA